MSQPESPHVVHVVATQAFAGVERYIAYVAPRLTQRGWRVTVVGGDPERMRKEFDGAPVQHEPYRDRRSLERWLRTHASDADIVHAHMTAAEFAVVRALRDRRPRLVSTRHFAARRGSSWVSRLATRSVPRLLDLQIAISHHVANSVGESTVVIPNGVPTQPMGAHDRKVVLLAQRLESEKRTDVAVRAWASSRLAGEGWALHIAGEGAERTRLVELAKDLGIARSVRFLGHVEAVQHLMASCGVFLATAPREHFGLSVAEAMANGAYVIAADGGSHPELLADDGGALFPKDDSVALSSVLRQAVESDDHRTAVGLRARNRQQTEYDIDAHVNALDDAYRSLLPG